jgi:two-component system response regulator AlgR
MNHAPLKILIADDEEPARNRLRELLTDSSQQIALEIIAEAKNGMEAIKLIEDTSPDLVMLDIRMPELGGLEVAQHLQTSESPPAIIFTTAYDSYAIKAFEVNAIDYLLKPIRGQRLVDALMKAHTLKPLQKPVLQQIQQSERKFLSVRERGKILLIPVADIVYLRAELKYVTIKTLQREYLLEESLTNLENEFAQRFVRTHRSYLVAKDYIVGLEKQGEENGESGWVVLLKALEEKLPVSRRQQHLIKDLLKKI